MKEFGSFLELLTHLEQSLSSPHFLNVSLSTVLILSPLLQTLFLANNWTFLPKYLYVLQIKLPCILCLLHINKYFQWYTTWLLFPTCLFALGNILILVCFIHRYNLYHICNSRFQFLQTLTPLQFVPLFDWIITHLKRIKQLILWQINSRILLALQLFDPYCILDDHYSNYGFWGVVDLLLVMLNKKMLDDA